MALFVVTGSLIAGKKSQFGLWQEEHKGISRTKGWPCCRGPEGLGQEQNQGS